MRGLTNKPVLFPLRLTNKPVLFPLRLTKKSLVTLNSPPSGRRSTRRGRW